MPELFQTESINDSNIVEAVKRLNQAFIDDHKTIQTLQKELAERDERLLQKIDEGFKESNQRLGNLENGFKESNQRLGNLENGFKESNQRLGNLENGFKESNQRLGNLETRMASVESSIIQMKDDVVQEQKTTNVLLRELIEKK